MRILYLSLAIVLLDQGTKLAVKGFKIPFLGIEVEGMWIGESFQVIGDFFRITFVENPGMAFGIDLSEPVKLFVSLFSVVASIALIYYIYHVRTQSFALRLGLAFILGGAIGNLIDRVFYGVFYGYERLFHGRVVDFFDFDFFNFEILGRTYDRWPIFNIADIAVSVGVFVLIFLYHGEQEKEHTVESEESSDENIKESVDSGEETTTPEAGLTEKSEDILPTEKETGENPENNIKEIPENNGEDNNGENPKV